MHQTKSITTLLAVLSLIITSATSLSLADLSPTWTATLRPSQQSPQPQFSHGPVDYFWQHLNDSLTFRLLNQSQTVTVVVTPLQPVGEDRLAKRKAAVVSYFEKEGE